MSSHFLKTLSGLVELQLLAQQPQHFQLTSLDKLSLEMFCCQLPLCKLHFQLDYP